MKILLSFDYELYFGESTGSQHKCMIRPTDELIKIAERHGIRLSVFADCGYLVQLEKFKHLDRNLEDDYKTVTAQLKYLAVKGHDVQLHIHPHWEDSFYDGKKWVMNTGRYRLHQFNEAEVADIFTRYSKALVGITGQQLHTFRAGGWCLQPFEKIKEALKSAGIKADSSVYRGGYVRSEHYYYDFRNCPQEDFWKFGEDPVVEDLNGRFIEYPISSMKVSPLFYWQLYLLGRINPLRHKPIGDGKPMMAKGYRKRILSRYTWQPVSADGYNARLLEAQAEEGSAKNSRLMVVIGHPKALSLYSIEMLDKFVSNNKGKHSFVTYSDLLREDAG